MERPESASMYRRRFWPGVVQIGTLYWKHIRLASSKTSFFASIASDKDTSDIDIDVAATGDIDLFTKLPLLDNTPAIFL